MQLHVVPEIYKARRRIPPANCFAPLLHTHALPGMAQQKSNFAPFKSLSIDVNSATPYSDATTCRKPTSHVKRPMNAFMVSVVSLWSRTCGNWLQHGYSAILRNL